MAVPGKTISSTFSKGSCEDSELFCQPCDRVDVWLPAYGFCRDCQEHLCDTCFNYHKRSKPSKSHILLDKDSMPQTQQLASESCHSVSSCELTKPCPKHKKEIVEYYCHDHDALLCIRCESAEHSGTFCKVDFIPDISDESLGSKEYTDVLKASDMLIKKSLKTKSDNKKQIKKSSNSLTDALTKIKQFRQDVDKRLQELEEATEDEVTALQLDNDARLKTAETMYDDIIRAQKASSDAIKQLNTSKQAANLFLELKSAKKLIKDNKGIISSMTLPEDIQQYQFKPNEALFDLLKSEVTLGAIAASTVGQSAANITTANTSFLRGPQQQQAPNMPQSARQSNKPQSTRPGYSQYTNKKKQEPPTASMLAAAPPQEQKQLLGERLFPIIHGMYPDLAGKITGMLLEIDNSKLLHMLDSPLSLKNKVEEAIAVLQAHQAKEAAANQQRQGYGHYYIR